MRYLVTGKEELLSSITHLSVEDSIKIFENDIRIQIDSETTGHTPQGKVCDFLSLQVGNDKDQIVIDATTVDITQYKELLESKLCIFANGKFDLMFLYNYDIHPTKIFDVIIAEQAIHLGWPVMFIGMSENQIVQYMDFISNIPDWNMINPKFKKQLKEEKIPQLGRYMEEHCGCSLEAICFRYLGVTMDKSARGEIIYNGLTERTFEYARQDVVYLNSIMDEQLKRINKANIGPYIKIEMSFVPVCAYMEWCGIYLNPNRWKVKMHYDKYIREKAIGDLDDWFFKEVKTNVAFKDSIIVGKKKVKLFEQNVQLSLFDDVDTKPHRTFEWTQDDYVTEILKILGFDTVSINEKYLRSQKGINDKFLDLFFAYKNLEASTYGQNCLDAINPITGRLHPIWKQIGTTSGRIACNTETQKELMNIKKLGREIKSINIQALPKTFMSRESFTPQDQYNNLIVSTDFCSIQARLCAMICNDNTLLDIFRKGLDSHNVVAKLCFPEELKDIDVNDVKENRPDLRERAKQVEFGVLFGSSTNTIADELGISIKEAEKIYNNYMSELKGIKNFREQNGRFVLNNGYIPCTLHTGGKVFWWDWCFWAQEEMAFRKEGFWDEYRVIKKVNPKSPLINRVRIHMKAKSKWAQRMSLNMPAQHSEAEILKNAMVKIYRWIINQNLFNKVKICACIHDEIILEYPKKYKNTPDIVKRFMEESAHELYPTLPIPAEGVSSGHWIH